MSQFSGLTQERIAYGPGLAIASNGSLAAQPFAQVPAGTPGFEVIGARFINGGNTTIASQTTTASAVTISVYKNASGTASRVATWSGSGTALGSITAGTAAPGASLGPLANRKLVSTDTLWIEVVQGANSAVALAANWMVELDVIRGYDS